MLVITSLALLAILGAWQSITALICIRKIFGRSDVDAKASQDSWGRAVVVLCLRGNDPLLVDALRGLMRQDYMDFCLRVVVDSESDPAWQSIKVSGADRDPRSRIEVLRDPPHTCGLKNAALMQVLSNLEADVKFLALADADTITHPSWLRELIAPLRDPAVGLTTGIRWYHPHHCSTAALIRLVWNAAATTQMIGFQIPWGGSLAISIGVVNPQRLCELWRRGLCEDTMLTTLMRSLGRRQVFVPSIIMINREDCRMGDLMHWIKRQLIVARLYHPSWVLTVMHGVASAVIPFAILVLIVWHSLVGDSAVAWQFAMAMLAYQVAMVFFLIVGLLLIQMRLKALGRQAGWMTIGALIRLPIAVVIIQILYPMLLVRAMFAKTVDWRSMTYRILPDNSVVHDGHRPYKVKPEPTSMHSL